MCTCFISIFFQRLIPQYVLIKAQLFICFSNLNSLNSKLPIMPNMPHQAEGKPKFEQKSH